jgi:squalene cyclase
MTTLHTDAVAFVLEHGNVYDKLYLYRTFGRAADQLLVAELLNLQSPDGGWPWMMHTGVPSSVVTAARTLELLLKAGLAPSDHPATDATCFLLALQRSDGGWSESQALAGQIPGDMPWISTAHSMTYATADVVNVLMNTEYAKRAPVNKAVAFLRRTQNDDGGWSPHVGQNSPPGTDIASMDVIVKALVLAGEGKQSAILRWAAEAIVTNWEDWKYPACAASALNVMLRIGYQPDDPHVRGLVTSLVESQQDDGGWSPLAAGPSDPGQTAYCVKQLMKCGIDVFPRGPRPWDGH